MSPVNSASRFERARVSTARFLLLHSPVRWVALKLIPRDHPYGVFAKSALPHLRETTANSLRPRAQAERNQSQTVLVTTLLYLAVADLVGFLPGLGLTPDPITPLHWLGLADNPVIVPSLFELIGL